jgi:hypothetical protein
MICDTWTLRACVRAADTVKQLQLPVFNVKCGHVEEENKKRTSLATDYLKFTFRNMRICSITL